MQKKQNCTQKEYVSRRQKYSHVTWAYCAFSRLIQFLFHKHHLLFFLPFAFHLSGTILFSLFRFNVSCMHSTPSFHEYGQEPFYFVLVSRSFYSWNRTSRRECRKRDCNRTGVCFKYVTWELQISRYNEIESKIRRWIEKKTDRQK